MAMNAEQMGQEVFNAISAVDIDQDSIADGSLGLARFQAMCGAIISHIQSNAVIASLATTSTPNDGAAHIHTPITVEATGKIS